MLSQVNIPALIEHARTGALPGKEACVEAEATLAAMRLLQGAADGFKPNPWRLSRSVARAAFIAAR